jgi:ribosomal protein S18
MTQLPLEKLNLKECKSNKEVCLKVRERVLSVDIEELINELNKQFIFHEKATRKIYTSLACNINCIIYGPGGFGKSVLIKAICEILGLPIIYKVGHSEMSTEELFGIPNMKKLLDESKYETSFENSIFSTPGILIFEEGMDVPSNISAALKDIITEGGLREGDIKKESLISSIIIAGNKSPEDLISDDSTAAFYNERFPIQHKMIWPDFKPENYLLFFNKVHNKDYNKNYKDFKILSIICSQSENIISPRVASYSAKVVSTLGIGFLDSIPNLDLSILDEINKEIEAEYNFDKESKDLFLLENLVDNLIKLEKELDYDEKNNLISELLDKAEKMQFSDPNSLIRFKTINDKINLIKEKQEEDKISSLDKLKNQINEFGKTK